MASVAGTPGVVMLRAVVAAFALALSTTAEAVSVGGVELAESHRRDDGTALALHGAGVRTKYFLDIYVAALYLPERGQSAQALRQRDQPGRLEMHIVYDEVSQDRLASAWRDGFRANNPREVIDTIEGRLARFIAAFPAMGAGDTATMTYRPGKGTRVVINGEPAANIDGGVFFRALLAVFVGPEPPDSDLKRGLLGKE